VKGCLSFRHGTARGKKIDHGDAAGTAEKPKLAFRRTRRVAVVNGFCFPP
jgi:hypothetical protein